MTVLLVFLSVVFVCRLVQRGSILGIPSEGHPDLIENSSEGILRCGFIFSRCFKDLWKPVLMQLLCFAGGLCCISEWSRCVVSLLRRRRFLHIWLIPVTHHYTWWEMISIIVQSESYHTVHICRCAQALIGCPQGGSAHSRSPCSVLQKGSSFWTSLCPPGLSSTVEQLLTIIQPHFSERSVLCMYIMNKVLTTSILILQYEGHKFSFKSCVVKHIHFVCPSFCKNSKF